jgi:hypothetical protein
MNAIFYLLAASLLWTEAAAKYPEDTDELASLSDAEIAGMDFVIDGPEAVANQAPPNTNVVFTTRLSDGSPNTWTLADLQKALELINRKYHRDCKTDSGRAAWHGKRISTVTDASNMVSIVTFEDGTVFRDAAPVRTPAQQVAAANKKRKTTVTTNGIPAALAEARLKRAAEIDQGPTNVTVTIEAGRAAE